MKQIHVISFRTGITALVIVAIVGVVAFLASSASALQPTVSSSGSVQGSVDGIVSISSSAFPGGYVVANGWAAFLGYSIGAPMVRVSTDAAGANVVDEFRPDIARQDVWNVINAQLNTPGSLDQNLKFGFSWRIPAALHDGVQRTLYFSAKNGEAWEPIGQAEHVRDMGLWSSVDHWGTGDIRGWALDADGEDVANQPLPVFLYVDGEYVASTVAVGMRADVANYFLEHGGYAVGPMHGFQISANMPARFRDGAVHVLEVYALEASEGLMTRIGQAYRTIEADGSIL